MLKLFAGVVVVAGFLLPSAANAQAVTGAIVGSLKDSSGAAVTDAAVTVVNPSTGLSRVARSDSQGGFVFPLLPAGSYNVSAEVRGFKKFSLAGVLVSVDQKTRADLALQVGEITEAIQVVVAPLAQADSSDLSATVRETVLLTRIQHHLRILPKCLQFRNEDLVVDFVNRMHIPVSNEDGTGDPAKPFRWLQRNLYGA